MITWIQSLILSLLVLCTGISHAETTIYYHTDALGSPVAATDEQGNVLWRENYAPYGDRLLKQDGGTENTWYTGKQHDDSIGLSYFGARWYDPVHGRFMAMDPVGFQEDNIHSFNKYAYANNNPYKYVDPDGNAAIIALERAWWVGGRIGAGINYGIELVAGANLGVLIYNGLYNEIADDGEKEKPKKSRRPSKETKKQADAEATDSEGKVRCQYCGDEVTGEYGYPNSKEYDHKKPWSQGGDSSGDNIKTSCRTCNRSKGGRTPEEWGGPNK